MRVAVRRSRALLRAGRPLIATDTQRSRSSSSGSAGSSATFATSTCCSSAFAARPRRSTSRTGQPPDGCYAHSSGSAAAHAARLLKALDSERYASLLDAFDDALERARAATGDGDPRVARERELKKLRRAVEAAGEEPADERAARRCASTASACATRTSSPASDDVVKRAKAFQDVLGEHQDAAVAEERLRDARAGRPAGPGARRRQARRARAREPCPRTSRVASDWRRLERAAR